MFFPWLFIFQAECYHYLFDTAIKLNQLGIDWSTPNHGPIQNIKGISGSSGDANITTKAMSRDSNSGSDSLPVRFYLFSLSRDFFRFLTSILVI